MEQELSHSSLRADNLYDFAALKDMYPNPLDVEVGALRETAKEFLEQPDISILAILKDQFDIASDLPSHVAKRLCQPAKYAGSVVVRSLSEGIVTAHSIEAFDWQLGVLYRRDITQLDYLAQPQKIIENGWGGSRQLLGRRRQEMLSAQGTLRYVLDHPNHEDEAINLWVRHAYATTLSKNAAQGNGSILSPGDIEVVHDKVAQLRRPGEAANITHLVHKLRSCIQWRRRELPEPYTKTTKSVIANLEGVPIEQIPIDRLQIAHAELSEPNYTAVRPALHINSATRATQNILTSLTTEQGASRSVTGILVTQLSKYDGDNPLGYGDLTVLANKLLPVLARSGADLKRLDPTLLADFPKAIDRILFITSREKISSITSNIDREKYELVADMIQRLAYIGVAGKLSQRTLSAQDAELRYHMLPTKMRKRLIAQNTGEHLTEAQLELRARGLKYTRQSFSPGRGTLS